MEYVSLTSIGDMLIARSKKDYEFARGLLENAQAKNEYFREKAAAKIFAFYELEHELIKHYVELKLYYPKSAEALEEQKPHLILAWNEAERECAFFLNKEQAE